MPVRFTPQERLSARLSPEDPMSTTAPGATLSVLVRVREHLLVSGRDADRGAAAAAGVALEWRPFLLGPIFQAQGWNDSPFNVYPVKGRYMWRDLERICAAQDCRCDGRRRSRATACSPRASPASAPARAGGPRFVRGVYRANFAEDREIGDEPWSGRADRARRDADAILAQAPSTRRSRSALRANTDDAIALGIFGAPSFVVGDELFWGNDRLDDALAWARRG